METKVFCNNESCEMCLKLETPVLFNFDNEHFKAFKDDLYTGTCKYQGGMFYPNEGQIKDTYFVDTECSKAIRLDEIKCYCSRGDCSWNNGDSVCTRHIIFVGKSFLSGEFVCKSFSQKKIKGHRDWFSLLNGNNAKGGHIDDDYAKKMDADSRKFKLFPHGHRDANPKVPTRR
jgi:hypothetical protein